MAADKFSFIFMKISPTSLVSMGKIQNNFYSKMRLVGPISIYRKKSKLAAIYEKGKGLFLYLQYRKGNICFDWLYRKLSSNHMIK